MSDMKKMIKIVIANGEKAELDEILADDLNNKDWERCLVPEMLGVPLKVKRFRHRYPNENISRDLGIFLMVDPITGLADNKWQAECGKIGFARTDGQDFEYELYYELFDYIYTLMDHYGDRNGAAKAIKRMTPAAFKQHADQNADPKFRGKDNIIENK
jgi:hypothetical protein